MSDTQTYDVNMDAAWDEYTSDALIEEANARPNVSRPAGWYTLQAESVERRPKFSGDPDVKNPALQGRPHVHVQARVSLPDGTPKGKIWFDASPVEGRRENGKLDRPSMLWGNLVAAVDGQGKPHSTVVDLLLQYPIAGRLSESFKLPDGTYKYPKSTEERAEYVKADYPAYNNVENLGKVK